MHITEIHISNFGKFHNKDIQLQPGLNVIYGENEAGKSTLLQFILGMLFGHEKTRGRSQSMDSYSIYEPWNSGSYYAGSMRFRIKEKEFFLERNFYHKEKTARLKCENDGEELAVEFGDLDLLLGNLSRKGYENTYCIRQAGIETDKTLVQLLQEKMVQSASTGDENVRLGSVLKYLELQKKELVQAEKAEEQKRQQQIEAIRLKMELLNKEILTLEEKLAEEKKKQELQNNLQAQWESAENNKKNIWKREKILAAVILFFAASLLYANQIIGNLLYAIVLITAGTLVYLDQKQLKTHKPQPVSLDGRVAVLTEELQEKQTQYLNEEEALEELGMISQKSLGIQQDKQAVELAMTTMQRISGEVYEDLRDAINETISGILSQFTNGAYDCMELDQQMQIHIRSGEKELRLEQLSRGTIEQLLLALRIGAGRVLGKEEQLPICLDETFGMYDDQRLSGVLKWLAGQKQQILLFTCQKREITLLNQMNLSYNRIDIKVS